MTYMAVAHGISGIVYFSLHYGDRYEGEEWTWWVNESSPGYWAQWADLTAELAHLGALPGDAGSARTHRSKIIRGSAGVIPIKTDMHAQEHRYKALHLSLRHTSSGYFLIVAHFTLPRPSSGLAAHAAVRFENRLVDVAEGVFEDSFEPYCSASVRNTLQCGSRSRLHHLAALATSGRIPS